MKYLMVLTLFLAGCANAPHVLANKDVGTITVPSADRPSCQPLPFPATGSLDEEHAGEIMADWVKLYKQCSDRGDRLLGIIDQVNDPKK